MNQIFRTFRLAAILVAGGIAAILLFTLLGSILLAVGIFVIVAAVAGGLQVLLFGRKPVEREMEMQRSPAGYEMIDITPPRRDRRPQ